MLTAEIQGKHLLSLYFDLFCGSLGFLLFSCPPQPSVVVVNFISTMKSNSAFVSFFFFPPTTLFIAVINLCLYIGLLQFCGVSFFIFFFSFLNFN